MTILMFPKEFRHCETAFILATNFQITVNNLPLFHFERTNVFLISPVMLTLFSFLFILGKTIFLSLKILLIFSNLILTSYWMMILILGIIWGSSVEAIFLVENDRILSQTIISFF